ncbi:hypothetical protein EDB92DRAFT_1943833 [Lactarius akahatsu]|uniref:HNH nuclease domain-containing protein n=1 Tax=Lactarius akahatsu TaxID=416441 RepID=A0AAD4QF98_9AGAM|nr:hypothetical protein EDB92DRAFT_1943833 [Lactarius akahatsu]
MVEIYLNVDGSRFPFLSIPLDDVQRLSIRPFKWLRYVLYSICGARGDLYARLGDPPVDYDSTELADHLIYFYEPSGHCIFIDHEGLNDRLTSTDQTPRRENFRKEILARDKEFCVVTREPANDCDAAHLIPRSKTDKYIRRVVEDRSSLYGGTTPMIRSIDVIENGVLLIVDLHRKLGRGDVAFLKTPNYGLDPIDIPRVEPSDRQGPVPADHFTLHRLKKPPGYDPARIAAIASTGSLHHDIAFTLGLNVDALFRSTDLLPAAIILDYVYGIAAYKQWNSKRDDKAFHGVIGYYRNELYVDNPAASPSPSTDNYEDEVHDPTNVPGNLVDCHDPDHVPTTSSRYASTRTGDEMAKAMDDLNAVLMLVRGITPEEAAKRRERRMEEEELKAQEASRSKVMEWMRTTDVGSL